MTALAQREHHCFISYASEDLPLARDLAAWLTAAGLQVWLDQDRLGAGAPVLDELTRQIWNARAFLLVLTEAALAKHYVKHEVDVACQEQVTQPGFSLLAVRTDPGLNPGTRFPALTKLAWMDLPPGGLDLATARRLLRSITPGVAPAPGARHVFVSCGWGENDGPLTRRVCRPLVTRGVRLVGDATDQKHFAAEGKTRVERIMSGCTGHLMILPDRRPPNKTPEEAYKYFLDEWAISRRLGLARRVFCASRAALPAALQAEAVEVAPGDDGAGLDRDLVALHDETEPRGPYVFLATDYTRAAQRNAAARDVIEHVLGMPCLVGEDHEAEQLSEAIVDMIIGANLVFADLACVADEATARLRLNLNTCIEAGIAKGARRAVFVTALDPRSVDPAAEERTRQLPFMFRNSQIHWYSSPVDYLARMHRLAMATRRRIINDELTAAP